MRQRRLSQFVEGLVHYRSAASVRFQTTDLGPERGLKRLRCQQHQLMEICEFAVRTEGIGSHASHGVRALVWSMVMVDVSAQLI